MTRNIKLVINTFVFSSSKCTKIRFRPGLALDPAGGAYDAPPDALVAWGGGGGYPLPIPLPAQRSRLELSALVLRPPLNTKSWLRQWISPLAVWFQHFGQPEIDPSKVTLLVTGRCVSTCMYARELARVISYCVFDSCLLVSVKNGLLPLLAICCVVCK